MFAKVYLYGSYSKGNAHAESDIDVAVIVPKLQFFHFSLFLLYLCVRKFQKSKFKAPAQYHQYSGGMVDMGGVM